MSRPPRPPCPSPPTHARTHARTVATEVRVRARSFFFIIIFFFFLLACPLCVLPACMCFFLCLFSSSFIASSSFLSFHLPHRVCPTSPPLLSIPHFLLAYSCSSLFSSSPLSLALRIDTRQLTEPYIMHRLTRGETVFIMQCVIVVSLTPFLPPGSREQRGSVTTCHIIAFEGHWICASLIYLV